MALNIEDKKAIVAEVNEAASKALSAVVADSCGITYTLFVTLFLLVQLKVLSLSA